MRGRQAPAGGTRLDPWRTGPPPDQSGAGSFPRRGRRANPPRDRGCSPIAADVRACARERIAREQALDALIARAVCAAPGRVRGARSGGARRRRSRDRRAPAVAGRRVSRRVALSGQNGAAGPALRGARAEPRRARTLGGCRFVPWRGRLLVLRELAAAEAPIALEPGADLLWDRRFAVSLSPEAAGRVHARLSRAARRRRAARAVSGGCCRRSFIPCCPRSGMGEGVAGVPHLGYSRPGPPVPPSLSFRPVKPLTPPSFTVV